MGGGSSSVSQSEQSAQAFLSQQFYGSCNITCTNIASDVDIDIIGTVIGGSVNLTQSCSVDANCMVSGSSDAASDILFKAKNSTNAKDVGGLFSGSLFNFDSARSSSRQDIKQSIVQSTTEKCKLASLNQMNDITILAANSVIGGSINIGQTGSTQGTCQLSNNLTAAASATAMASNVAQSGKDKKAQKGGLLVFVAVFAGIMIAVAIIAKIYTGSRDQGTLDDQMKLADEARAFAGCAGGKKVIDVATGKPVIDPVTRKPICPIPELPSASEKIDLDLGKNSAKFGNSDAPTKIATPTKSVTPIKITTKSGKSK